MPVIGSAPRSSGRPKQATPAERGVEYAAHQARLKEEAAKRRDAKAADDKADATAAAKRRRRRG